MLCHYPFLQQRSSLLRNGVAFLSPATPPSKAGTAQDAFASTVMTSDPEGNLAAATWSPKLLMTRTSEHLMHPLYLVASLQVVPIHFDVSPALPDTHLIR